MWEQQNADWAELIPLKNDNNMLIYPLKNDNNILIYPLKNDNACKTTGTDPVVFIRKKWS